MKIAFIGDIVGKPGRDMLKFHIKKLKDDFEVDFVIANGENVSHGFGLTIKNAHEILDYGVDEEGFINRKKEYTIDALYKLLDKLDLKYTKNFRIECYDISNLSGKFATGSMVVFIDGEKRSDLYRKFKIKYTSGIDDVGAMREVLARRFNHLNDWGEPDAIVLDGGQGHLNMAEKLMNDFGLSYIAIGLLAVAKGPTRKKVDIYESKIFPVKFSIKTDLKLLERLREEAHRFAITYHRSLRDKNYLK